MNWERYWNEASHVLDSDPLRQVGRTFNGVNYSEQQLTSTVVHLESLLAPGPAKRLLDLACGNGLITSRLAPLFNYVVAVDYSRPLIDAAQRQFACANVEYVVGNAIDLEGVHGTFDAVLICGAFQYFGTSEARRFFDRVDTVLATDGRIVLGDVPDRDRIWNFYRGLGGKIRYGAEIFGRHPILGHWWRPGRLVALARRHGLNGEVRYQPSELPNHYFRYDLLFRRSGSRVR